MSQILWGLNIAREILDNCSKKSKDLHKLGKSVSLAVISIGNIKSFESYLKGIYTKSKQCSIKVKYIQLSNDISQNSLINTLYGLNEDNSISGILLLKPFPKNLKRYMQEVCDVIEPKKDIDCVTSCNLASSFVNKNTYNPCTAEACLRILDNYGFNLESKNIVVVGRSLVLGKPLANMLINRNATVTVCHLKTKNLQLFTQNADIVISAIGKPNMLNDSYFSQDQIVIDCGINWDSKYQCLCGDVKFNTVKKIVRAITPVPGGVGPLTSSILIEHLFKYIV